MRAEGNVNHSPATETTQPSPGGILFFFFFFCCFFGRIYQPYFDILNYLWTPVRLPQTMYLDMV
jgi:hypothetical protein